MAVPKLVRDLARRAIAVISPFYAIPEALCKALRSVLHGYKNTVSADLTGRDHVACAAFAASAGLIWAIETWRTVWVPNRFFGFDLERNMTVILPTFTTGANHIGSKLNIERQQEQKNLHEWVAYPAQLAQFVQEEIGENDQFQHASTSYMVDETYFSITRTFNPDALKNRTVISMGSSSSNLLCAELMRGQPVFYAESIYVFAPEEDFKGPPNPDSGYRLVCNEGLISRYKSYGRVLADSDDLDWAVLSKVVVGKTAYFLCAGLAEAGTKAALSYLLQNWRTLRKQCGNREFYVLLKVRKHDRKSTRILLASKSPKSGHFEPVSSF